MTPEQIINQCTQQQNLTQNPQAHIILTLNKKTKSNQTHTRLTKSPKSPTGRIINQTEHSTTASFNSQEVKDYLTQQQNPPPPQDDTQDDPPRLPHAGTHNLEPAITENNTINPKKLKITCPSCKHQSAALQSPNTQQTHQHNHHNPDGSSTYRAEHTALCPKCKHPYTFSTYLDN